MAHHQELAAEETGTHVLVQRVREGDEAAARDLIQRLYPLVLRIIRSHRPRRVDEEDLAQMVFVRLFTRLEQWRATAPFEHWVSRVAVNVCLSQIDYQRVRPEWRMADLSEDQVEHLDRTLAESGEPEPHEGLSNRELVGKLLDDLPPRDRLVLQLLDLEGRSVEEVSQTTGWSRTMVKVQAFRARHKMRKRLARLLQTRTSP